jgi:hypothetical protein
MQADRLARQERPDALRLVRPFGRGESTPPRTVHRAGGHHRERSAPRVDPESSRSGSRARCRGFSPRQLRPDRQAQHGAMRCCTASLAADPLRPSTGGASPTEVATSGAPCRGVGPVSGSLGPRRHLVRPSCAGPGGNPHRQGRPCPRLFKARTARQPETPSIGLGPRPCDRGGRPPANCSCACCLPAPVHVLRWDPPPSAVVDLRPTLPRRADRLAAPDLGTGKMLLTDFCNRRATRAPDGSFDSRGDASLSRGSPRPMEPKPQRTTRVTATFDDAPRAAADTFTRPPMRRMRMPPDPAGLSIESSPQVAPPGRGVFFRGRAER